MEPAGSLFSEVALTLTNAQINSPYEFFYLLHQKPLQPHSSKVEVVAVSLLLQGILFHTHHPRRTINGDIDADFS